MNPYIHKGTKCSYISYDTREFQPGCISSIFSIPFVKLKGLNFSRGSRPGLANSFMISCTWYHVMLACLSCLLRIPQDLFCSWGTHFASNQGPNTPNSLPWRPWCNNFPDGLHSGQGDFLRPPMRRKPATCSKAFDPQFTYLFQFVSGTERTMFISVFNDVFGKRRFFSQTEIQVWQGRFPQEGPPECSKPFLFSPPHC